MLALANCGFGAAVNLFSEVSYFSSFSDLMLSHAKEAAARYIREFSLDKSSRVVEVASNDGYFLKNFKEAAVPCLGIEPRRTSRKWRKRRGSKRWWNSLRRTWRTD